MFSRVLALISLTLLVIVVPSLSAQCTTSSPMCCESSGPSNSPEIQNELTSLGLDSLIGDVLASVDVLVGLQCTSIIGNGADCSQQPLCCEDNYSGNLVGVNCSPITVL